MPWYGNLGIIPSGFLYCDGTNGTPDLRGRTLIGTGNWNDSFGSSTYTLGAIGGERLHKLTVAEMPSHKHGVLSAGGSVTWNPEVGFRTGNTSEGYPDKNAYGSDWISYTGGDQPHNIMQPFMAVHFIMKL